MGMRLFWSSRSPYVRKVMIAAHELGLADRLDLIPTQVTARTTDPKLALINPLGQIPTLVLESGEAIYDSYVICEYFDGLAGGRTGMFPVSAAERADAQRRHTMGDGMIDTLIQRQIERDRTPETKREQLLANYLVKAARVMDRLEGSVAQWGARPPDIGQIATVAALSYMDFRYADDGWRKGRPQLTGWFEAFTRRPSFDATQFRAPTT